MLELSLDELVSVEISSASKFRQTTQQAPSAVQIISAEDIRRHGWRRLTEALDSLPGVYTGSDRAYDFIGARGFLVPGDYNNRFLLLLNGQRVNDNIYDQGATEDVFAVDLALVERIEYIPGPGSSIYGSNALFGVVNVITRSAKTLPALEASVRVTSDGRREARVTGSRFGGGNGPDIVASLSHSTKAGRDQRYPAAAGLLRADGSESPDGQTRGLDRLHMTRVFASLEQGGFSASAWAVERDIRPSTALYGTNFDDQRLVLTDRAYGVSAGYEVEVDSHWKLDTRLALQNVTYRGDYPYFDEDAGAYLNRETARGDWWSGEARVLYSGLAQHKLIAGVEFSADYKAQQRNFDVDASVNATLAADTRSHRRGIYLQDEWHFAPDWRLSAGLRRDHYAYGNSSTSPRLGLIWQASERTTLKLLAGRAHRVANAYESAYADDISYLANLDLEPETIRTVEAVGELRLNNGIVLGASVFDYRMQKLIRQVELEDGSLQYQNQPDIKARGLELHYQQRRRNGLSSFASLALNQTQDADGERLANSPYWVAKLRGSLPLLGERLAAALELNAIGPRITGSQDERGRLESQMMVNGTLTAARLAPGLEAQLRVVNLLNSSLEQPASDEVPLLTLPLDARTWQLNLNYAF